MTDPLSLLPFALAAGGGAIDEVECRQLVAAGLAIRPRAARVTLALTRHVAAILLPPGPAFLIAIAACDGVPIHLLDPHDLDRVKAGLTSASPVGVVFTRASLVSSLPAGTLCVLLDDAPGHAVVHQNGDERRVDLGGHFGLDLEGEREAEGQSEICVREHRDDGSTRQWTHRELLRAIRAEAATRGLTPLHSHRASPSWHRIDDFVAAAATLYVGGRVRTDG